MFTTPLEILDLGLASRQALWITNGTAEGTDKLAELHFDRFHLRLERVVLGPEMFFLAGQPPGAGQIWRTDGTDFALC